MAFAWPSQTPAQVILVLMEDDGTVLRRYQSATGSFRRIEHNGRMFFHQGIDRETGERVYLPEVVAPAI